MVYKNASQKSARGFSAQSALIVFFLMFVGFAVAATTPTVTGVSAATADGSYKAGDAINISVTFSETVMIQTGTPVLHLETGATDRDATYASGATETILYFTYTVQAGDTAADLDYKAVDSLEGDIRATTGDHIVANNTLAAPGAAGSLGANKAIVIDTTAPTVAITLSDYTILAGETATVTFDFSQAPKAGTFTTADITAPNGALSAFAVDGSNSSKYTATFTPTADTNDSSNVITVGIDWTDAALNAPAGSTTSDNYVVDTKRPIVVIELSDAALKIGDTATAYFNFSEAPTGFTVDDVTAPNGALSNFAVDESNSSKYTATFTPTTNTSDATNVITVGTSWTGASGNAPASSTDSANYVVETTTPIVVISYSANPAKAGAMTIIAMYSEAIVGTPTIAIDQPGTTDINATEMTVANQTYFTYAYTVHATSEEGYDDGTATVTLSTVADAAGNNAAAPINNTFVIDTTAPTVAITDNQTGTANSESIILYTFTFDETVTGFASEDITVAHGTKGTFTAVSGTVYTLIVVPAASSTDSITVDVAGGVATDLATNGNTAATQSTQAVDTVLPTVTITDNIVAATLNIAGGNITYTFTFSKTVTGFDADSIEVTNGTPATFTAVSGTEYTLLVVPLPNFEGNILVDVDADVALDTNGNGNTAATQSTQAVDTLSPTITNVSLGTDGYINAAETASGVNTVVTTTDVEDGQTVSCTVLDSTPETPQGVGPKTSTTSSNSATVASTALTLLIDGTLTVTCSVSDAAGNPAAEVADTAIKDVVAPSGYSASIDPTYVNNANKTAFAFTFADATVGDTYVYVVTTSGGEGVVTANSTIATATDKIQGIDVTSVQDGTLTLSTYLVDAAGNKGTNATDTVTKDVVAPAGGSITYTGGYHTVGWVSITYTTGTDGTSDLNTATGNLQRSEATLSNGVCGTFGNNATIVSEFDGNYTDITVVTNKCYRYFYQIADNAGNTVNYTSENVAKVDTTVPTIISLSSDGQTYDAQTTYPKTITAIFSESLSVAPAIIVGKSSGNVTPSVSNCGDENASTWCFTVEESGSNLNATRTMHISAAQDLAGNTMVANNSHTYAVNTIDTLAPSVFNWGYTIDKTTKIVKVWIYGSEALNASTLMTTFDGANMTYVFGNGSMYTFSYNYTSKAEDTYDITVSSCTDLAGNACVLEPVYFPMSIDVTDYGYTKALSLGWNNMGLPKNLLQNLSPANGAGNYTIQNVLDVRGGIAGSYDYLQYRNGSTCTAQNGSCWLTYDPAREVNDLTVFNDWDNLPYWIHMNVTDTLKLEYKALA